MNLVEFEENLEDLVGNVSILIFGPEYEYNCYYCGEVSKYVRVDFTAGEYIKKFYRICVDCIKDMESEEQIEKMVVYIELSHGG